MVKNSFFLYSYQLRFERRFEFLPLEFVEVDGSEEGMFVDVSVDAVTRPQPIHRVLLQQLQQKIILSLRINIEYRKVIKA